VGDVVGAVLLLNDDDSVASTADCVDSVLSDTVVIETISVVAAGVVGGAVMTPF
jgi:hypothetical protein